MMKLTELLSRHHEFKKLSAKFPKMARFADEIEVIEWKDEFCIADKNADFLDSIEFLNSLLKDHKITKEEYLKLYNDLNIRYASKTLAVSFINKKKVSFRDDDPSFDVLLHELGHVYFRVPDFLWDASWGGGEVLLQLALNDYYHITERNIRRLHSLIRLCYKNHSRLHALITKAIAPQVDVYPHVVPIAITAGFIPDVTMTTNDLKSEKWKWVEVTRDLLFEFLQHVVDGLKYKDVFCINYAKALGIID